MEGWGLRKWRDGVVSQGIVMGYDCRPRGFWLMDPLGHLIISRHKHVVSYTADITHVQCSEWQNAQRVRRAFRSTSYIRHVAGAVCSCTSELTWPSLLAPQTAATQALYLLTKNTRKLWQVLSICELKYWAESSSLAYVIPCFLLETKLFVVCLL
jgi:hypothetical protein